MPLASSTSEELTITCYENHVPPFIEQDLDKLYESIYSSLKYFRNIRSPQNLNTYEVRKNGKAIAILLFKLEKDRAIVWNEVMHIDGDEIERFVHYIFLRFENVKLISFQAIQTSLRTLAFPFQSYNHIENIVVSLPRSVQEYQAMLGGATRKTIKKFIRKMKQDFPSCDFRVFTNDEIDRATIHKIFELKKARMHDKNEVFAIDDEGIEREFNLAKLCGLVGVILIDGRICAGSISYRVGENYFLKVNTHDPEFNAYRLGTLNCFFTICECIDRYARECHLLWGRSEYKFRLLGVQHDLKNLTIYRSWVSVLLNWDVALNLLSRYVLRQTKLWLHRVDGRKSLLAHFASRCKIWIHGRTRSHP